MENRISKLRAIGLLGIKPTKWFNWPPGLYALSRVCARNQKLTRVRTHTYFDGHDFRFPIFFFSFLGCLCIFPPFFLQGSIKHFCNQALTVQSQILLYLTVIVYLCLHLNLCEYTSILSYIYTSIQLWATTAFAFTMHHYHWRAMTNVASHLGMSYSGASKFAALVSEAFAH